MSADIIEAIESLKTQISTLWLSLPLMNDAFIKEAESAAAKAKRSKCRLDLDKLGDSELRRFKNDLASELRAAAAMATERGIELATCRKLAAAIDGGIDTPKPELFTFDAVVELDRLIESVRSSIDDGRDEHKQRALELWNKGGKSWTKIAIEIKDFRDGPTLAKVIRTYAENTSQKYVSRSKYPKTK